jgi:hypothetical protein
VSLTWRAPASSSDPVDSYEVNRAASGSTQYSVVGTTTAASTAFTDSSVTAGQTYVYEVRSVDASGQTSSPSNAHYPRRSIKGDDSDASMAIPPLLRPTIGWHRSIACSSSIWIRPQCSNCRLWISIPSNRCYRFNTPHSSRSTGEGCASGARGRDPSCTGLKDKHHRALCDD